ncbi:MAG: hypothetical protein EWV58_21955 [Microcystis aeruginosa Ma_MB_F_20061100_S19]|nr:MAG: hypothetical protein EWV58_21955 [Microcystis aeruginosa Ma_MB_F_20061100_S19]TRU13128.1 MAG: hypothetical protein EWV59_07300 [Microcystis aeruginosa Ma_MB_F_20061100_S19D]
MSDIELPVVRGYSAALSSVSRATPLVPDSLCTLTALCPIHAAGSGRNTGRELEKPVISIKMVIKKENRTIFV